MLTDTVTTGFVEMSYFCFGTGERPFVILPGIDPKSILLSAKAVEAAYRDFGEQYTVYVFDRRLNMPQAYSIREMADDAAAVMRCLGITAADVFGASQGGMIAMCLAVNHPELVHAMALGSTTAYCSPEMQSSVRRWIDLAQAHDLTGLTADFIDNLYSEATLGRYRDMLLHINDNVSDEDLRRFIIQAKALDGFDIRAELVRIQCPVLAIGCKGDKLIPYHASQEIAEHTGGQCYLYGSEYGHCVFDEAPDYKQRLAEFFSSVRL